MSDFFIRMLQGQVLLFCLLAIVILRPWLKYGILNPNKKELNIFDRCYLFLYEFIIAILILNGILVPLPVILVVSIFMPNRRKFLHSIGRFFTGLYLKIISVETTIQGTENIPGGPVIFIQNIRNHLDGAAALAKLPSAYRTIYQRPFLEIPLIGWLIRILGELTLEPEEISLLHEDVLKILKVLGQGESVLAFAEERIGRHEIHGSVALLALQSKHPVVPVGISRKTTAPRIGAFFTRPFPYEINIVVGKPILLAEQIDDKLVREQVKEQIAKELRA